MWVSACRFLYGVSDPQPFQLGKKKPSILFSPLQLYVVSIYIYFTLLSSLPLPFTWTKKRLGFFSWESLGEVCCSVSKQWERNPVFPGPVSLPRFLFLTGTRRHDWYRVRTRSLSWDTLACSCSAGSSSFGCVYKAEALFHFWLYFSFIHVFWANFEWYTMFCFSFL